MSEQPLGQRLGLPATSVDYLSYLRQTRRILALASLSSLFFAALYAFRAVVDFRSSVADGWATVAILAWVLGVSAAVVGAFCVGIWVPAAIRTIVLRRRLSSASFYVVKRIPVFWDRLDELNPRHSTRSAMQNSVLRVDSEEAAMWEGVVNPKRIDVLPLERLSRIDTDRTGVTPFRRRIIVLVFETEGDPVELPLALRTISSLGYGRLSRVKQKSLVDLLMSLSRAHSGV